MKAPRPPSGRCKRLTDGSAGGSRRRGISESRRPDSTGPLPAIRMRQQRRNSPQPGGGRGVDQRRLGGEPRHRPMPVSVLRCRAVRVTPASRLQRVASSRLPRPLRRRRRPVADPSADGQ